MHVVDQKGHECVVGALGVGRKFFFSVDLDEVVGCHIGAHLEGSPGCYVVEQENTSVALCQILEHIRSPAKKQYCEATLGMPRGSPAGR